MTVRFRLAELIGTESRLAFSKRAGVSYPTIVSLYHNRAQAVTLDVLAKVAGALGVEPGELFERVRPKAKRAT